MTGRTAYRFKVTGTLVAQTGVHVGSESDGVDVDMQQATDGEGRVHIPGTSLTGALRTALGAREHGAAKENNDSLDWWGDSKSLGASRITICDAPITGAGAAGDGGTSAGQSASGVMETRPHVSIDPNTRTAVPGHLYTQNVVPAGARFRFEMTVDVPVEADHAKATEQVNTITKLLSGSGLKVGHGATTGLGLVRLTDAAQVTMDLRSLEGLKAAVLGGRVGVTADRKPVELADAGSVISPWQLRVTVPWRPKGPLMSKQAVDGGIAHAYPLTTSDVTADNEPVVRLLLPGSSIKGVIRSHASYILRTLRQEHDAKGDFRDWMSDRRLAEVLAAFGTPGIQTGGAPEPDSGEPTPWDAIGLEAMKGVIDADDVVTEAAIPLESWQRILVPRGGKDDAAAQQDVVNAIDQLNTVPSVKDTGLWFDFVTRNAIDRWTGGVAAGALYSHIEPYASADTTWRPMVFTVDLQRLARFDADKDGTLRFGEITTVVLTLLLFVLRDLADGYISFGFATSRGLGEVEVKRDQIQFAIGEQVAALDEGSVPAQIGGKSLAELLACSELVEELNAAWRERFNLKEGNTGR